MSEVAKKPRCFIAMPITTHPEDAERWDDQEHWLHVMDVLFVPAVERAGFEAVRPITSGADVIHSEIFKHITGADMLLCDLSGHNPNVFFELGVRTSLNLPVALVRDEHTRLPFDTGTVNTYTYESRISSWTLEYQIAKLAAHIEDSVASCDGENPLWRVFGLTILATRPDPEGSPIDAKLELLQEGMQAVRRSIDESAQAAPSHDRVMLRRLQMLAQALGRLLGAESWLVDRLTFSGEYLSTIEYSDLRFPVDSDALAREAWNVGFQVVSAARKGDKFNVLVSDHDRG